MIQIFDRIRPGVSDFPNQIILNSQRIMNLLKATLSIPDQFSKELWFGLKLCLLQQVIFVQWKKFPDQNLSGFPKLGKNLAWPGLGDFNQRFQSFTLS